MKKTHLSIRDQVLALPRVHERDGALYVRIPYKDPATGKPRSKEKKLPADVTPEDAIAVIAELKARYYSNPAALSGERMLFDELLAEYLKAHPKTPRWYSEPLRFFAGRKIVTLTYADCFRFKTLREQAPRVIRRYESKTPRKRATINRELEILRGVLLFAVRHGWLDRNPMTAGPNLIIKGEEEQRDRIPTPDEEERLLAVCVPPREHLRGLIIAATDTGLRRSALLVLRWSMVEWERRLLAVPKGNQYKRRPKLIGLTDRLWTELRALWEQAGRPADGIIFAKAKDFKKSYKTACRLAGIVGLQFRDFRHKFATNLMEAGVNERVAMKIIGHTNATTHQIYTNIDERLALQVADALNQLHAGKQPEQTDWPLASELPQ